MSATLLLAARSHVAAVVERYPEAASYDADQWAALEGLSGLGS
jgi:hypothetical protein